MELLAENCLIKVRIENRLSSQIKALEYISVNPETKNTEYLTLFESIMFLLYIYPESPEPEDDIEFKKLVGEVESILSYNKSLISALKDSYVIDKYEDTPAWDKLQCVLPDLVGKGN